MQKVIVTTSGFTGYSTIFKVDGDSIDLHGVEETPVEVYEDLCFATLPFDVKYEIFERLILNLIKEGLIKKALQIMLTSSSQICKIFYCKYIGNYQLNRGEILDHTIALFKFIEDISYVIFHPQVETLEELVLSVHCRNNLSIDIKEDKRWPLRHISQTILDRFSTVPATGPIKRVRTGPCYSDIVWVAGVEERGIIYTSLLKGPILILEVYHGARVLVDRRTSFFSNVIRMLKLCLGEMSGVYLLQPYEEDMFVGAVQEVV